MQQIVPPEGAKQRVLRRIERDIRRRDPRQGALKLISLGGLLQRCVLWRSPSDSSPEEEV